MSRVFTSVPEKDLSVAYNAMTAAIVDAFESCAAVAKIPGTDKQFLRRYYRTGDVPGRAVTARALADAFISKAPSADLAAATAQLQNMLELSWCLAIGPTSCTMRVPRVGDAFDATWMIRDSQFALSK